MYRVQMIIEKNTTPEGDEYSYYIEKVKRQFIISKKWFRAQYLKHNSIVEEIDKANSIHAFNWFKEELSQSNSLSSNFLPRPERARKYRNVYLS